jgi:hypothetical protein
MAYTTGAALRLDPHHVPGGYLRGGRWGALEGREHRAHGAPYLNCDGGFTETSLVEMVYLEI